MSKVRLAIIGNGMVGHRFIEDLLDKSDAANFDITVFCEEPRKAYDRVHLSSYFSHHTAEELSLVREGFYEKHGVKVLVGERAITINRQEKVIHSSAGRTVYYDKLIMATGSYPWIPPIKGSETQDCFVYRTIEDLNAIESCARRSKRGAVVGGGLLGLEAAGALKSLGVETHVIEFAPMLMAEQLDHMGGEQLRRKIESMGVRVHTSKNTKEIVQEGTEARKTMRFADGSELEVDFIVFSTGIRPRDKLATQCGLDVAPRGGIVINDTCQTSDPDIYAIGECASWNNRVYGLVAPGYKMAQVAVDHILETENAFEGADLSAKLKLLGVDVGGIGDAHGRTPGARSYVYLDESKEVYKRLIVSEDNKTLLGAVLVGDVTMRAITVRQPWAWAIIFGQKDVENRTRNIAGNYRGPVAIHASKGTSRDELSEALEMFDQIGVERPQGRVADLGFGVILGIVDLTDVHDSDDCFDHDIYRLVRLYKADRAAYDALPDAGAGGVIGKARFCSPWAGDSQYHLMLANPRPLPEPIPYRGQLGLWNLPDDVLPAEVMGR